MSDPKIKKNDLVRRKTRPYEENMIVGAVSAAAVRVYKYDEKKKGWHFLKIFPASELRVVGDILNNPPELIG